MADDDDDDDDGEEHLMPCARKVYDLAQKVLHTVAPTPGARPPISYSRHKRSTPTKLVMLMIMMMMMINYMRMMMIASAS